MLAGGLSCLHGNEALSLSVLQFAFFFFFFFPPGIGTLFRLPLSFSCDKIFFGHGTNSIAF